MDPYLAQVIMFGGNFAPRQWALCQGQLLSIAQNTALFALIGTIYGGNGQTTFALPDFRGRMPVGAGNGPGLPGVVEGEMSGASQITLTLANLPSHTHAVTTTVGVSSQNASSEEPAGNVLATQSNNFFAPASAVNGSAGGVSTVVNPTGGSQPFSKYPPYLGIIFIICTEGIFPSRN